MSRIARRRNASSTMLRSRVWSGSSIVSMLSASVRIIPGIHHRSPATAPPSWRSVKVALSLSTRDAISCVVVIHTLPTIGNRVATTAPPRPEFCDAPSGIAKEFLAGEIDRRYHRCSPMLPFAASRRWCAALATQEQTTVSGNHRYTAACHACETTRSSSPPGLALLALFLGSRRSASSPAPE